MRLLRFGFSVSVTQGASTPRHSGNNPSKILFAWIGTGTGIVKNSELKTWARIFLLSPAAVFIGNIYRFFGIFLKTTTQRQQKNKTQRSGRHRVCAHLPITCSCVCVAKPYKATAAETKPLLVLSCQGSCLANLSRPGFALHWERKSPCLLKCKKPICLCQESIVLRGPGAVYYTWSTYRFLGLAAKCLLKIRVKFGL